MEYKAALNLLLQLVDHERTTSPTGDRVRYDLRRMAALLDRLGNIHRNIPTVHIAGTKGKGSTAAMCASVLTREGYPTGLFVSPHLHTFRERICLDGAPVTEEEFASLLEMVWREVEWVSRNEAFGEVTMFEALTAMAFSHFSRRAAFQVLEVGLGGRLDTTNLATPQVCAITSLSLDHTAILGTTIGQIAAEKAGIIKPGVPVVVSPQGPDAMNVIDSIAGEKGAALIKLGKDITWTPGDRSPDGQDLEVQGRLGAYRLRIPLIGQHQLENASAALAVLELLIERGHPISQRAISEGFRQVSWPCRMEVLARAPLVVCDGAHNPDAATKLRDTLPGYLDYSRVILVVGVSRDKDIGGIAQELSWLNPNVIATRSRHPRAAPAAMVAEAFLSRGPSGSGTQGPTPEVEQVEGVDRAMNRAMELAGDDDLVLATGSLFVAAEARESIKGIEPELYPQLQSGGLR